MDTSDLVVAKLTDVSKEYTSGTVKHTALRHVNLEIRRGEYISVTGPSGSGKSTLLHILALLDTVTSGVYQIEGADVTNMDFDQRAHVRSSGISLVFQSFNLIDDFDVVDNVGLPLKFQRVPLARDVVRQRCLEAIEKVGLSDKLSSMPKHLSGGQQQRLAFARAIVTEPRLLLLDEPTGNLDSENSEAILELIDQHHKSGNAVCLITHEKEYAARAQRHHHLIDGNLVQVSQ